MYDKKNGAIDREKRRNGSVQERNKPEWEKVVLGKLGAVQAVEVLFRV